MIMLTGYVAMLREAAKADAERRELAHARAAAHAARAARAAAASSRPAPAAAPVSARPAAPPAPAARPAPPAPAPDAEVIDISTSVTRAGKEFYDQYADAKRRAVGD
jgi:hypothetical protein